MSATCTILIRIPSHARVSTVLLLLSAFVVHLCPKSVSSTSIGGQNFTEYAKSEQANLGQGGEKGVRSNHTFTNVCSHKLVRFVPGSKKIDAKGLDRDNSSEITVVSVSFGGLVYLQHATSKRYICFNGKGKLKVRWSKGSHCVFEEIMDTASGTYMYLSHKYRGRNYYLGFNKGGKKMTGPIRSRRNCYKFLKSGGPYNIPNRGQDQTNGGPGNVAFGPGLMPKGRPRRRHERNRKSNRRRTPGAGS